MSRLQDERGELAVAVATEIVEAFNRRRPHYTQNETGGEVPISYTLPVPLLFGKSYSELNAYGHSFDQQVSYNKVVNLRKGKGIIASLEVADGKYTGQVKAQAAMDEFDL